MTLSFLKCVPGESIVVSDSVRDGVTLDLSSNCQNLTKMMGLVLCVGQWACPSCELLCEYLYVLNESVKWISLEEEAISVSYSSVLGEHWMWLRSCLQRFCVLNSARVSGWSLNLVCTSCICGTDSKQLHQQRLKELDWDFSCCQGDQFAPGCPGPSHFQEPLSVPGRLGCVVTPTAFPKTGFAVWIQWH